LTGDFTSVPLRGGDAWTAARLQQGRVLLDGDWNLNIDAAARERRQLALEAIGPAGVLQGSTGFKISFAADGTPEIGAGAMWVGGLYAVNPATLGYPAQEGIAALPESGQALLYLDAFTQEVQAAEDPGGLLDPALDGVDTTTRTRVAWRVRAVPVTATGCADAAGALPAGLISSGSLDVTRTTPAAPADPCAPPDDPRGKLPDGLLRVEVLDSGTETTARFAWSYENGAAAVPATVAGATVTLAPSPSTTFFQNDLVEVSTLQRRADRADNGPLFGVASVEPGAGGSVVTLSAPSAVTGTPSGLCLRRWDGQVVGAAAPVAATLGGTDVGVAFTARPGSYLAGDWWVTRVRGSSADAVDALAAAPPDGTEHYVASLAVVDLTAKAVLSDCRPQFPSLTGIGGCCTLNVAPSDVGGGASLQTLLAGYANRGPVTVCLAPGTYILPAPLVIGPELNGVTLQGCDEGAVLAGPAQPGPEFTLGLIVVQGGSSVTIRGVELSVPLVGFTPAADAFSGLPDSNKALLGAFATGLQVAIGISVSDSTGLLVTDCTFGFPDPGQANVFGAGIYAKGAMEGVEITRCTFQSARPPVWAPFHDLAAGNQAPPPYQLTFGYLQVATAPEPGGTVPASQLLHDTAVQRCLFQGVTVPVLALTQLGTLRIDQNTVRNCYGGFWLYSVSDPSSQLTLFDSFAIGNSTLFADLGQFGGAALCERIVPMATALVRVLPATPPAGGAPRLGRIGPPSPPLLARARQTFTTLYTQIRGSGAAPATEEARAAEAGHLAGVVGIIFPPDLPTLEPLIPPADTGTSVTPRLDLCDCQVDAVIGQAYSGAALILVDFSQSGKASAVVHGNRMRTRFASGEAVMGIWVAEACVTGNIVMNEVAVPAQPSRTLPNSFSLTLLATLTPLGAFALAISGNLFIDPPVLPTQTWQALNTVIGYSIVPSVASVSPAIAGVGANVSIGGSGFTAATAVQFGTASATAMTVGSDDQITATVPPGTGAVDVTVTTPAGTSATSPNDRFTYLLILE
jgi:Family of unknown function (DUF6519)/IPT/TIG domain